jgi:antitoxin (DNA-binding transcriptional repressor) of toxin-antitoxin stability system
MIAPVMDLRYRTKKVLRALEAGEEIVLTHRDIEKGKIVTLAQNFSVPPSVSKLAAVGMWSGEAESVEKIVARLRKPRSC